MASRYVKYIRMTTHLTEALAMRNKSKEAIHTYLNTN